MSLAVGIPLLTCIRAQIHVISYVLPVNNNNNNNNNKTAGNAAFVGTLNDRIAAADGYRD